VSYLDIFDLDCLAGLSPFLGLLSSDPVLHRNRLRVVAPSRIEHSLFAEGCHGTLLRPSIADLVRMNVMRGIGIERRWRLGIYFYSSQVRMTAHILWGLYSYPIQYFSRPHTYLASDSPSNSMNLPSVWNMLALSGFSVTTSQIGCLIPNRQRLWTVLFSRQKPTRHWFRGGYFR
jgi:hypothetical protein